MKQSMFHRTSFCLAAALLALLIGACSKREDPEQRIRALIGKAELAAEKKEIGELRSYVSDRYSDDEGRDRRAVDGILQLYLLRHGVIHLLTRIESIKFPQPTRADAVVYVAMAGRPITSAAELGAFNANLYRFEFGFAEEDKQWRLARATWRPAEPTDFIRN